MEATYSFNALDPIYPPLTDIPAQHQTYIRVYKLYPQVKSRTMRVQHVNTLPLVYSSILAGDQATESTFLTFKTIILHFWWFLKHLTCSWHGFKTRKQTWDIKYLPVISSWKTSVILCESLRMEHSIVGNVVFRGLRRTGFWLARWLWGLVHVKRCKYIIFHSIQTGACCHPFSEYVSESVYFLKVNFV